MNKPVRKSKILVLGDCGVGKTSFIYSVVSIDQKDVVLTPPCIEFYRKIYDNMSLEFIDTCGMEAYRSMPLSFIRHADFILLFFDLTSKSTFHSLPKWIDDIIDAIADRRMPVMVVGNKSDLLIENDPDSVDLNNIWDFIQKIDGLARDPKFNIDIVGYYTICAQDLRDVRNITSYIFKKIMQYHSYSTKEKLDLVRVKEKKEIKCCPF